MEVGPQAFNPMDFVLSGTDQKVHLILLLEYVAYDSSELFKIFTGDQRTQHWEFVEPPPSSNDYFYA